jgi:glycosyltransferase involved in cell wall biosynthesis
MKSLVDIKRPSVAYFTNIAPHYREKLWFSFAEHLDVEIHFFFGNSNLVKSINFKSNADWTKFKKQIHEVTNLRYKGKNGPVVYQTQVLKQLFLKKWGCIILLGDTNILSSWLLILIAKFQNIPIIFWGHGLYGNEKGIKKLIRKTFYTLSDINLVYGNWAKKQMVKEGFEPNSIKVIYNSINYQESKNLRKEAIIQEFYYDYFLNKLPTILFIGRLTKEKKLHLLIEAVHKLNKVETNYNLIFIGDGDYKNELETISNNLSENVYFYGACYEEEKISKLVANADLCVSPGNVGLTAIHAMSYGTPVSSNNDFKNQGPEFEAIIEGETGCFFDLEKNNLAETISNWFKNSPSRDIIRQNCYKIVDQYYNPYNQTRVMKSAVEELIGKKNISKS